MRAPEIETNRLRLRAHRPGDFPACAALWADPVVTRFIGGKPSTPQQTWLRLLSFAGLWPVLAYGYWAVEERASGKLIGEIGFADFKREFDPAMRDVPELGFVFAPTFHGKGYATEAARAAIAWGDEHLTEPRTVCMVHLDNAASLCVAQKCGYREFKRSLFLAEPAVLLERANGWPARTRR